MNGSQHLAAKHESSRLLPVDVNQYLYASIYSYILPLSPSKQFVGSARRYEISSFEARDYVCAHLRYGTRSKESQQGN